MVILFLYRKLTSSQITLSTKSDPYNKKNETPAYELPDEEAQTAQDIYNTQEVADVLYDDLDNVRKQTLAIAEDNIYGGSQNALYSTQDLYSMREQHAGYHEEPFNPVEGSNLQDPLYQFHISQTHEDLYSLNRYPHVDNSQDINAVRDQFVEPTQNCIQGPDGITNPELDNIYIYQHLSGWQIVTWTQYKTTSTQ